MLSSVKIGYLEEKLTEVVETNILRDFRGFWQIIVRETLIARDERFYA